MAHAHFVVVHETTDNSPINEPQPPPDDGGTWHAISHHRGRTSWRCVRLHADDASDDPDIERLYQEIGSARSQSEGWRILGDFDPSRYSPTQLEEILAEARDLINELPQ
jgi:hypothetical protein